MEKENRSKKQLEQEKSRKICAGLDHIFEDGKGKCIICGMVDRSVLTPQTLSKEQEQKIADRLGVKLRDSSIPREKFNDEVELPPHLKRAWDFAVDYANKYSMAERRVYKPTAKENKLFSADKIKIRIDNETGKIVKIFTEEEEEKEEID